MSTNIYHKIDNDFKAKSYDAQLRIEALRADIYKKIPRIEQIDNEIVKAGISAARQTLENPSNREEYAAQSKEHIIALDNEKRGLLAQAGMPANWTDRAYECLKCHDTGKIYEGDLEYKCSCYTKKYIDYAFANSGLDSSHIGVFGKFDESRYDDEINIKKYGIEISPQEYIKRVRTRCEQYIEADFYELGGKNLLFVGPTGTGKTFMSECIANALLSRGETVLYISAPVLFEKIYAEKYKEQTNGILDLVYDVGLLIIDDLGTETRTDSKISELLTILNVRAANDIKFPCKTLFSTNMGNVDFAKEYDERVASRIVGNSINIRFTGQDLRLKR